MEERAKGWSQLYENIWTNYNDFKQSFLETFWSFQKQRKIQKNIDNGELKRGGHEPMLEYFITMVGKKDINRND